MSSPEPRDVRPAGALVVLAVLLVVGASLTMGRVLLERHQEARASEARAVAEHVGGDLRSAIAGARVVASTFARDPDVMTIARGDHGRALDRTLIEATTRVSPNSVASVVAEDGRELARAVGDTVVAEFQLEVETRGFVETAGGLNAMEGFTVLVGPFLSPDTGGPVISAAARVVGSNAVFQVEVPLDEVLLDGARQGATVVDESGEVVAGADLGSGPSVRAKAGVAGRDWTVVVDVATASTLPVSAGRWQLVAVGGIALALLLVVLALAAQQRRLFHNARVDPSTGLANRHQLGKRIDEELAAGQSVTLVVVSLIRFRRVVEVLGHAHADRLLWEVARRLRLATPKGAVLARTSEEELAVALHGDEWRDRAIEMATELCGAITTGLTVDGVPIDLGARVGVATAPDHARDAAALLRRAASALRAAEMRRRDVLVYTADLDLDGRHQLTLAGELEAAIEDGSIDIALQPKLSLSDGRIIGMEALARWHRPTGDVPPVDFIPLAEATGRIGALTLRVLERALDERARLADAGHDVNVAVNLSAVNLSDPALVEHVHAALVRHDTAANRLVLELTETSIMADPNLAVRTLSRLRDLGVRISIDDFGTGYSAMSYLTRLPVDEVKIDRSFVGTDTSDLRVVRSVIRLAHDFGLSVVAEGVENAEVLEQLRLLDCDEAQGYHIARPMAGRELRAWLATRHQPSAARLAGSVESGLTGV